MAGPVAQIVKREGVVRGVSDGGSIRSSCRLRALRYAVLTNTSWTGSRRVMKYYWARRRGFPPESVESPHELSRPRRNLCVVCTQLNMPAGAQRKLVQAWCDVLPTLKTVEHLWFLSRVPQDLFNAACEVPRLKGLYVKWSGVKSIEAVTGARHLQAFHLGDSAQLQSIDCLSSMSRLRWLGLANIKRITRLDPIGKLHGLEGLAVDGSVWTTQRVETLAPIGQLPGLKFLSITNLRAADKTLRPLFALRKLGTFWSAQWWDPEEVDELHTRNPKLPSNSAQQPTSAPSGARG